MNRDLPTALPLWEWPTVLSLDAPCVAVLWQALFAYTLGATLGWHHYALLGVSVWLVYSADRLLDGFKSGRRGARTSRHRFYLVHRQGVAGVWLGVLLVSLFVALTRLRPLELLGGTLLLGATLTYFWRRHGVGSDEQPKELQIALIFGAGVGLFLPFQGVSAAPLLLAPFVGLCFLNCALIGFWEADLGEEDIPFARRAPALAAHLPEGALLLAALGALGAALTPPRSPLLLSLGGSGLLLYALHLAAPKLSPATLRVLADAALLTPLVPLLWGFYGAQL